MSLRRVALVKVGPTSGGQSWADDEVERERKPQLCGCAANVFDHRADRHPTSPPSIHPKVQQNPPPKAAR